MVALKPMTGPVRPRGCICVLAALSLRAAGRGGLGGALLGGPAHSSGILGGLPCVPCHGRI